MRWVAAAANRCEYARATAEADLRRAGLDGAQLSDLKKGPDRWAPEERAALKFARQMTLDAGSVTDGEVAELSKRYGEDKLVAMVLLLAYSNFQDRLLLTLGVPLEEGGPLAPVEVHFPRGATPPPVPERARPADLSGAPPVPSLVTNGYWELSPQTSTPPGVQSSSPSPLMRCTKMRVEPLSAVHGQATIAPPAPSGTTDSLNQIPACAPNGIPESQSGFPSWSRRCARIVAIPSRCPSQTVITPPAPSFTTVGTLVAPSVSTGTLAEGSEDHAARAGEAAVPAAAVT